jgi:2-deoxy-D-gluconate 3-dehydrogenase
MTTETAQQLIADVVDWRGQLDILVNCAGLVRRGEFARLSTDDLDDVMTINLRTPFLLSQAAAQHMVNRASGKIINIASLTSFIGGFRQATYTASKSAISGLTKAMSNELAVHGVNVNAIAPGYIATQINADVRADPVQVARLTDRIPAGRWGSPADIGGAAVFLASDAADYVHGHILAVDGGCLSQ